MKVKNLKIRLASIALSATLSGSTSLALVKPVYASENMSDTQIEKSIDDYKEAVVDEKKDTQDEKKENHEEDKYDNENKRNRFKTKVKRK